MIAWLVDRWQWPVAALFGAAVMLALLPAWYPGAGLLLTLVYLQLPIYFVHQYEEHRGDRFRAYVNGNVFHGLEALTKTDAFVINFVFVWIVDVLALTLARDVAPGFGVMATDLALLNAFAHIGVAIARREYNPGLWSALLLFLPVSGYTLYALSTVGGATVAQQLLGAGIAIGIHVAIVGFGITRARALSLTRPPRT